MGAFELLAIGLAVVSFLFAIGFCAVKIINSVE